MTTDRLCVFRPVDTWVFRDGTPFTAGETPYSRPRSVFPPSIGPLQGAVRTLLAIAQGWRPGHDHNWPQELGGVDDPGILSFRGPWPWHDQWGVLFPVPRHLLRHQDTWAFLRPSHDRFETDLGAVQLPEFVTPVPEASPVEDAWLTGAGLTAVLNGERPSRSQVVPKSCLIQIEGHTGLTQETSTRKAQEGLLYHLEHVRPTPKAGLAVYVSGLDPKWTFPATLVPLGGEGRLAWLEPQPPQGYLPDCPELVPTPDGRLQFTVTLITPGRWADLSRAIYHGPPGIAGTLVTACIGPIDRIGGWDLKHQRPRPAVGVVPPGSTWFYEADARARPEILALHGQCLGEPAGFGWGHIVIGRWPKGE
jgi:CRISPR-associated protein Cmr3